MESQAISLPTRAERRREERRREKLEAAHVGELLEELAIRKARRSFWHFRRWLNPALLIGWFQREAAGELQQFVEDLEAGRRPKLLLEAPRQHGKTKMVVELIAWACGRNPDLRTIYASFSDRLGVRANATLQRIIASRRFQAVFPETRIQLTKTIRNAEGEEQPPAQRTQTLVEFVGRLGSFRNTTVLGPVNGESLDLGIVDDPLKGRIDSHSAVKRDTAWNWFATDFLGCFQQDAGLLVIATRRHLDDPVGRMRAHFGAQLRVVSYKAIATEDEPNRAAGEALFPELKDFAFLEQLRAVMPPADWAATMQQDPQAEGGNIIRGEWFGYYRVPPVLKYREIFADTAQKTKEANDFSVFQCWGLGKDGKLYLLDQARGKWTAPELKRRAVSFWQKHKAAEPVRFGELCSMRVEDKASGTGLIQELQAEASVPVVGIPRAVDKYTRVCDVLGYLESGYVLLPETEPWISDFVAEAEAFTADDSHAHDDQLDPMVDAIKEMLAGDNAVALWEKLG